MSETIRIYTSNINSLAAARIYSKAFGDDKGPWKEFLKNGNEFLPRFIKGQDLAQIWRDLGFQRAYPLLETSKYIEEEVDKPGGIYVEIPKPGFKNQVVACGWGYTEDSWSLTINKWKETWGNTRDAVAGLIQSKTGYGDFWYLSEVFVDPKAQGQGLGSKVVDALISAAPSDQAVIMRTNANSPMTLIAQKMGMEQIMGPRTYRGETGNIMVDTDCIIDMLDPVNPDRVLYYLPARKV